MWIHEAVVCSCNDGTLYIGVGDVGDDVCWLEGGFVFGEDDSCLAAWDVGLVVSDT